MTRLFKPSSLLSQNQKKSARFQTGNAHAGFIAGKTRFQFVRLATMSFLLVLSMLATVAIEFEPQPKTATDVLSDYNKLGLVNVEPLNQFTKSRKSQFISQSSLKADLLRDHFDKREKAILGTDYVMEDLESGAIFRFKTGSSELIADLQSFPVQIEPNFSLRATVNREKTVENKLRPAQIDKNSLPKIQSYLKTPWQYRKLVKDQDDKPATVALIDSGFAFSETCHERTYKNLAEAKGMAGVDDDQNGYIDDICGWNYLKGSPVVEDENGHGTHLGGLIIAMSNAEILPLQVLDANNEVLLDRLLLALDYAINHLDEGDIINLSIGSEINSDILKSIINKADAKGITIVASAGNNNSPKVLFPAAYSNVVAVSAVQHNGNKAYYANYGQEVDFSFYGDALSFRPGDNMLIVKEGTSQAAAIFSAVLATTLSTGEESKSKNALVYLAQNSQNNKVDELGIVLDWPNLARSLWAKPKSN